MSKSNQIWNEQRIASHTVQFRATIMVLAHLSKYKCYSVHKVRILTILANKV